MENAKHVPEAFTRADAIYLEQLVEAMVEDAGLRTAVRDGRDSFETAFDATFHRHLADRHAATDELARRLVHDAEFSAAVGGYLATRLYQRLKPASTD